MDLFFSWLCSLSVLSSLAISISTSISLSWFHSIIIVSLLILIRRFLISVASSPCYCSSYCCSLCYCCNFAAACTNMSENEGSLKNALVAEHVTANPWDIGDMSSLHATVIFHVYIYIYTVSYLNMHVYKYIYILYIIHNIYNICLYLYIHIPSSSLFGLLPVKSILVHSEKSVSWRSGSMSAKAGITVAGRVRVMKRGKRGFPASPKTPQGGPTNKTLQGCKSDAVNLQLIR